MLLLMQDIITLKCLGSIFPILSALSKMLSPVSPHVVYVAWTKLVIIYELVAHSSSTVLIV